MPERTARTGEARDGMTCNRASIECAVAPSGRNTMNDTRDTNDPELARLCELLERASTPERRTDVAIRLCNALGIPCAGGN